MSETFTDIEQFEGTCYKASNWEPLGLTKGFQRHRADYFQWLPQKLWIKSLNRNALRILTAMDVPKAYQSALNHDTPERDLVLKKTQMESLLKHFREHSLAAPIAAIVPVRCWCSLLWPCSLDATHSPQSSAMETCSLVSSASG